MRRPLDLIDLEAVARDEPSVSRRTLTELPLTRTTRSTCRRDCRRTTAHGEPRLDGDEVVAGLGAQHLEVQRACARTTAAASETGNTLFRLFVYGCGDWTLVATIRRRVRFAELARDRGRLAVVDLTLCVFFIGARARGEGDETNEAKPAHE